MSTFPVSSLLFSRRQCLLVLLLLTCTEGFARPSAVRPRSPASSRRGVLQAPRTNSAAGSLEGEGEEASELYSSGSDGEFAETVSPLRNKKLPQILIPDTSSQHQPTSVEFVAETILPTDMGAFQLRAYRVPDQDGSNRRILPALGGDPCVIYAKAHPPFGQSHVPVRIHDQCLTSEVFRSQRYVVSSVIIGH